MGMWERFAYRTLDDLTSIIAEAVKLPAVVEVRIRAGVIEVRTKEGVEFPVTLRSIRLPSDDLTERVRASGVEWRVLYKSSLRSALLEGISLLRRESIHATHIASGDMAGLLRALRMYEGADQGMTKWLAGLELVEHKALGPDVHLLCGGPRAHGSVSDITATVRLEQEEPDGSET